jgi:hypothetical protein
MLRDFKTDRREMFVFDIVPSLCDSVMFPRLPSAHALGYSNAALWA